MITFVVYRVQYTVPCQSSIVTGQGHRQTPPDSYRPPLPAPPFTPTHISSRRAVGCCPRDKPFYTAIRTSIELERIAHRERPQRRENPSFPHCAIIPVAAFMTTTSEKADDSPKSPRNRWFTKALLDVTSSEWDILALSTAFKLLLFPA